MTPTAPTSLSTITHWIGGKPFDDTGDRWGDVFNPAHGRARPGGCHSPTPPSSTRAVAAAARRRRAWGHQSIAARTRVMFAFRELARAAQARAGRDPHQRARQGAARRARRGEPRTRGRRVRVRAAAAHEGRVLRERLVRRRQLLHPPAARRRRRHHAVQLSGDGADVDVSARHRVRERVHPEAVGERPVGRDLLRGAAGRGRPARRRVQRRARRQGGGRRDPGAPGHRGGQLRRVDADRALRLRNRARSTASACRRSAARRTTWSCCPTRTSTWRRTRP